MNADEAAAAAAAEAAAKAKFEFITKFTTTVVNKRVTGRKEHSILFDNKPDANSFIKKSNAKLNGSWEFTMEECGVRVRFNLGPKTEFALTEDIRAIAKSAFECGRKLPV